MNQPINSSKPIGQQLTTASAVSDQSEVQPRPARGPEKPRAAQTVIEKPQSIGGPYVKTSHEVTTDEMTDGDASEAIMRGHLGRQITGRDSEDAQNPIAARTQVERRAAPIESPSRDFEGEGRTYAADESGLQAAPVKAVGTSSTKSAEDEPLEAQERLILASSTLDASSIGTLSGSQRFKQLVGVYEKEPFVSQRSAISNLLQLQMRMVGRMLG